MHSNGPKAHVSVYVSAESVAATARRAESALREKNCLNIASYLWVRFDKVLLPSRELPENDEASGTVGVVAHDIDAVKVFLMHHQQLLAECDA
jgi:hypothetical protein